MAAIWMLASTMAGSAAESGTNAARLHFEEPVHLTGKIFRLNDRDLKTPLFHFERKCTRTGTNLDVLREYTYPDGKLAARERLVYHGDDLFSYELEELQIGARGKVTVTPDPKRPDQKSVLFERQVGKRRSEARETFPPNAIVSDTIAPFIIDHWDDLMRGDKLRSRYLVVERLETVGFTFSRVSDSTWQGRPVVVIKMQPTSRIISALVDPLVFYIEKNSPHRVYEYRGRTTPKLDVNGSFKDLDARNVFEWK